VNVLRVMDEFEIIAKFKKWICVSKLMKMIIIN